MRVSMKEARHRLSLALVGTLALLAAGCGLDKVEQPPVQAFLQPHQDQRLDRGDDEHRVGDQRHGDDELRASKVFHR